LSGTKKSLGPLELEVMQRLWARGQATVKDIWEGLYEERKLAYTTVATVLRMVEKKGFVTHHLRNRQFVYTPKIEQEEISGGMLRDLLSSVFNGSASRLVTTLVEAEKLTEDELERIRAAIDKESGAEGKR
jgi:predicted transcriptional regulator